MWVLVGRFYLFFFLYQIYTLKLLKYFEKVCNLFCLFFSTDIFLAAQKWNCLKIFSSVLSHIATYGFGTYRICEQRVL